MSEYIFGQSLKPKLVLTGNYKKTKKIEFGEAKIASECFTNRLGKKYSLPKLLRFKWITIDIDILVWYETLTCQLIINILINILTIFNNDLNLLSVINYI